MAKVAAAVSVLALVLVVAVPWYQIMAVVSAVVVDEEKQEREAAAEAARERRERLDAAREEYWQQNEEERLEEFLERSPCSPPKVGIVRDTVGNTGKVFTCVYPVTEDRWRDVCPTPTPAGATRTPGPTPEPCRPAR